MLEAFASFRSNVERGAAVTSRLRPGRLRLSRFGRWIFFLLFNLVLAVDGRAQDSPSVSDYRRCLSACLSQLDSCLTGVRNEAQINACGSSSSGCRAACKTAADAAIAAQLRNASPSQRGRVSDICLSVSSPRLGSECGSDGRRWYWTLVRANRQPGCPRDLYFTYEANGKNEGRFTTPLDVQTCGAPPQDIRIAN